MNAAVRSGWTAARVVKSVLAAQVVLAGLLVLGEFEWRLPRFEPRPLQLDAPVRPGDQTRRYRLPAEPGARPLPVRGDMPPRLTLLPAGDGAWSMEGEIAPGDAERMIRALDRERPARVSLNSPGGSVADALEIGRALRRTDVATEVRAGEVCLSACPYILAAGVARSVAPDGLVGVHQHYFGENTVLPAFMAVEDVQRGQAEVMGFLVEMGIDLRLMQHALSTPPDRIYLLVEEELREYGLVAGTESGT